MTDSTILCGISTRAARPVVPLTFCHLVFDCLHSLSHPGFRATQQLVTMHFVWPGIRADVRKWTRSCIQCQHSKVQWHTVTPLPTFPTPSVCFDKIHLDIVGPLPPSRGYTYLLTCIDHFTRWPEAILITNITEETVARAFVSGWISRFGTLSTVTTDRGCQFESALWEKLMQLLGSKCTLTTTYHPIAYGLVERFHRQLKVALKAQAHPEHWTDALPMVLLGIRTALKEDIQCTAAELVYDVFRGSLSVLHPNILEVSTDYVAQLKSAMRQIPSRAV